MAESYTVTIKGNVTVDSNRVLIQEVCRLNDWVTDDHGKREGPR